MSTPTEKNQASGTQVTTWEIDPPPSRVEFSARLRLLFLANHTVQGRFSDVRGTLTGDESDPTTGQVSVTIRADSLDTKSPPRDHHLRSADFFEVDTYPHLMFTSQRIEALDRAKGHYRVTGWLTIRDVAREVTLDAWHSQKRDEQRHTFNLTTVLNRRAFGLLWSRPVQKIADDVQIALHIEVIPASLLANTDAQVKSTC